MKWLLLLLVLLPVSVLAQSEMVTGKAMPKEVYQKVTCRPPCPSQERRPEGAENLRVICLEGYIRG
jgi:hypothetical protein